MTWFHWVLISVFAISALGQVLLIGEERKPITPGGACAGILVNGFLIFGVLYFL